MMDNSTLTHVLPVFAMEPREGPCVRRPGPAAARRAVSTPSSGGPVSFRFWQRIRLAPWVTLNLSKSSASLSFGPPGAKYTIGPNTTLTRQPLVANHR